MKYVNAILLTHVVCKGCSILWTHPVTEPYKMFAADDMDTAVKAATVLHGQAAAAAGKLCVAPVLLIGYTAALVESNWLEEIATKVKED